MSTPLDEPAKLLAASVACGSKPPTATLNRREPTVTLGGDVNLSTGLPNGGRELWRECLVNHDGIEHVE